MLYQVFFLSTLNKKTDFENGHRDTAHNMIKLAKQSYVFHNWLGNMNNVLVCHNNIIEKVRKCKKMLYVI